MSILKLKYKAHKLVNTIFYLLVFVVGFLLGFASEKIDYNKLISQVLMIDNVSAYTLFERTTGSYPITIDEDYIMEKISLIDEDFDITIYNKVMCVTNSNSNSSWTDSSNAYKPDGTHGSASGNNGYKMDCYFIPDSIINQLSSISYSGSSSANHNFSPTITGDIKKLSIMLGTTSKSLSSTGYMLYNTLLNLSSINTYATDGSLGVYLHTNFDFEFDYSYYKNVLDFSDYSINLEFNENLFKDNPDFKEVCVDSSFSITKKTTDGTLSESDHDFIWFPYGITGIKQFNYSTEMSNGYYSFDEPYKNYYFSSLEEIDSIWNTEFMASNFESKGYTDKYKYYGYTAYLFLHWYDFTDGNTYNFFPIFELTNNITTSHISSSDISHGGGGLRLDGDEEIKLSDEYCFYIKNEYEVNEVNLDEWGDYHTSVNTPNGTINYGTTIKLDNNNSEDFLSQPLTFLNSMKDTINLINSLIYEFYMSLPVLLRTFIITAFIILIIMLIMTIGGY